MARTMIEYFKPDSQAADSTLPNIATPTASPNEEYFEFLELG